LSLSLPAKLQKASVALEGALLLELFGAGGEGNKRWLLVERGQLHTLDERPVFDAATTPRPSQQVLRKEAVPSGVMAIEDSERIIRIRLERREQPLRTIVVERDGRSPRWLLLDEHDAVLVMEGAKPSDGRDLRRKQPYLGPLQAPVLATATTVQARPVVDELRTRTKAERKRLQRLLQALRGDFAKHGDPASLLHQGEWLKSALGQVHRGMTSWLVIDEDGKELIIPLAAELDAKGNLTRLFTRARKARLAQQRCLPRIEAIETTLVSMDAALASPSWSDDDRDAVERLLRAPTQPASARRQAMRGARRQPWRSFDIEGVVIRVGRSAKDNDALVKASRGLDDWFHARHLAGSHVVVPAGAIAKRPSLEHDAAALAAWFSPLRKDGKGDVQHTQVKHLKKPPGAPPGLVLLQSEGVIAVRIDAARMAALLAAEVRAS
jgi:predicted ribosome quality control (RQC) complex YloA/Tae2 family protein